MNHSGSLQQYLTSGGGKGETKILQRCEEERGLKTNCQKKFEIIFEWSLNMFHVILPCELLALRLVWYKKIPPSPFLIFYPSAKYKIIMLSRIMPHLASAILLNGPFDHIAIESFECGVYAWWTMYFKLVSYD